MLPGIMFVNVTVLELAHARVQQQEKNVLHVQEVSLDSQNQTKMGVLNVSALVDHKIANNLHTLGHKYRYSIE